eukprot:TRINITY_DN7473_c0_g1_i3.p1 TRINITY_DN7473_c0_g1~~TRINITY_DN7473_c0_g1_i3.p1  ORF type:complete len:825 (+),score=145.80 TRINITY_DN7473_c0_g1_i3:66-2540(+)
MGCCGGRSCGDSSDGLGSSQSQGEAGYEVTAAAVQGRKVTHPMPAELIGRDVMVADHRPEHVSPFNNNSEPAETASSSPDDGRMGPAAEPCEHIVNAPYGCPTGDEHVGAEEAPAGRSTPAASHTPSPSAPACLTPRPDSAAGAGATSPTSHTFSSESSDWELRLHRLPAELKEREQARETDKAAAKAGGSPLPAELKEREQARETDGVSANTGGSPLQPRRPLAAPEQGGPMQPLPPPPRIAAGMGKETAKPPVVLPAEPPKKGFMARVAQKLRPALPAAVVAKCGGAHPAGKQVLQGRNLSPVMHRPADKPALGPRTHYGNRAPAANALGPRKLLKVQRPARPEYAAAAAAPPHDQARPGAAAPRGPLRETIFDNLPPPKTQPPPLLRPSEGSLPVAGSADSGSPPGTSPGHSPVPEYAPVAQPVAPVRPSEPSDAAAAQSGEQYPQETDKAEAFRVMTPGDRVTGYKLQKSLGKGGFGEVWMGIHPRTGTLAAIKVSKAARVYHDEAEAEVSMLHEVDAFGANATKQLRDWRQRIVRVYEYLVLPGAGGMTHPCMVMELQGPNLVALTKYHNERRVAPDIVKTIMKQVFQALSYLAEMQVVHGDLKPDNILLGTHCLPGTKTRGVDVKNTVLAGRYRPLRGENYADCLLRLYGIKLIDFGKASSCQQPLSYTIQTLQYRAPEVVSWAHRVTPAVDIWSAGCLCFEMLTSDYLFEVGIGGNGDVELHPELWAAWISALGLPPAVYRQPGWYQHADVYFDEYGRPREHTQPGSRPLRGRLERRTTMKKPALAATVSFLTLMLKYSPGDRLRAQDALRHRWLRI